MPTLFRSAGAPSLSCSSVDALRLGYIPTTGAAFIITLSKASSWSAETIELRNLGAAQSFEVVKRTTHEVPDDEVAVVSRALERAGYSAMTPDQPSVGADGDIVAIEVRTPEGYRIVQRIGSTDSPFLRAAMIFFELAQLPYPNTP
jgi:hypothetical protein